MVDSFKIKVVYSIIYHIKGKNNYFIYQTIYDYRYERYFIHYLFLLLIIAQMIYGWYRVEKPFSQLEILVIELINIYGQTLLDF